MTEQLCSLVLAAAAVPMSTLCLKSQWEMFNELDMCQLVSNVMFIPTLFHRVCVRKGSFVNKGEKKNDF